MLLNEDTALLSQKCLLVPYEAHHVPTYHDWMQDEEIRAATASERLTLDEEYRMQKSWRHDNDKLTFIVCLPPAYRYLLVSNAPIVASHDDAPARMVGDINLFLFEEALDDEDGAFVPDRGYHGKRQLVGELELMIARKEYQGQGIGRAAVLLFLWYVVVHREEIIAEHRGAEDFEGVLRQLRVKIHHTNTRSIRLFESLLFKHASQEPNYFGEIEMVLDDLDVLRMYALMRTYEIEGCEKLEYQRINGGHLEGHVDCGL
ncbi:GNAT domain-containing protein [Sphaerosporella brunnea]|uniref:GNAT domain-containing protein n=1 Tax=Sphaerosporella brunnea TaxID=1250544 RepID=A0A5J5EWI9_9PEZI|nr:GNAT domain-containing protein [Sphaerosporella brunnea]